MYKILDEKILESSVVSEPFISKKVLNPQILFDRMQRLAEQCKGIVMPNLNNICVNVLEIDLHDFNSSDPLAEAKKWVENNLLKTYISHKGQWDEFEYQISKSAIRKYLSPTAIKKSDSIHIHLSVLKVLPDVINASIEVEIHASYSKLNNLRKVENDVDRTILMHRFYGAIMFLGNIYRVKTTIKEYRNVDYPNNPYTFEAIKIELLDSCSSSPIPTASHPNSQGGLITNVANLLKNVEKSYDKGKFLLEESKNQ